MTAVPAVVVDQPNSTPVVREVVLPALGSGDVRVQVAAAGVCHSDLAMIDGTLTPQFPLILGHEASGVLTEVGAAVRRRRVGERVVLNWAAPCRSCWFCEHDQPWLCQATEGVLAGPGGHLTDGTPVHASMGVGAFAHEVVVPARSVVPVPAGVPLDLAALLGCAVLTGFGAVHHTAGVQAGQSVAIVGLGGVGLAAVLAARLAGADPIVGVDISDDKEKLALAAGATHFVVSDPKAAPAAVRALTGGRGADHAFDCVGRSQTIRLAWSATRRGGHCTIVGIGGRDQQVIFNALELFHQSRTIATSIYGETDPDRDIPILAQYVGSGTLDLEALVTHRIGLTDVPAAFGRMEQGHGARSLIILESP